EIGQDPWMSASTLPEVYFAGQPSAAAPATATKMTEAAEAWDRVKDTSNTALLEAFVARYKETFYADLARARIEELRRQVASAPAPAPAPATPPQPQMAPPLNPSGTLNCPWLRCLRCCTQGRSRHDGRSRLRFGAIWAARFPPLKGGGANFRRRALAQHYPRSPARSFPLANMPYGIPKS